MGLDKYVAVVLDRADSALADELRIHAAHGPVEVDKLTGSADQIVIVIELTAAALNTVAAYLTLKGASPRSHLKQGTQKSKLDLAAVEEIRKRLD